MLHINIERVSTIAVILTTLALFTGVPRKNSQDSMESTFMNYCEGQHYWRLEINKEWKDS